MESKQGPKAASPRAIVEFIASDGNPASAVSRSFAAPLRVLQTSVLAEVGALLDAAQAEARAGRWCVGFVAYEAAPAFDPALRVHPPEGPLAWFGVFEDVPLEPLPDRASDDRLPDGVQQAGGCPGLPREEADPATPSEPARDFGDPEAVRAEWGDIARASFDHAMGVIRDGILAGDQYQVNLTGRLHGRLLEGRPLDLFAALRRAQPGGYAAYIETGDACVLSVSPELFFDWDGDRLLARPMKGTAPRGADPVSDAGQARALRASDKELAENVMIVDLIRNDVSRVAVPHSVKVPRLFELQPLSTVWQMTSDVVATTRPGLTLSALFTALFPCGSVTGAPKVQAMRAIRALETEARGAYCGAIGVLRPGGGATFNVGIRTVTARGLDLTCGIGSGVTSGSNADGEWQEWRHKRAFLERSRAPFALLETLALDAGTLRNLEEHLARMSRAARHFGYPWDVVRVRACLASLVTRHPSGSWRVRLQVDARGRPQADAHPMPAGPEQVRLDLAPRPFEAADGEFVRFKTTRREHYDAAAVTGPEVFDTLLWNDRGELTECTRGNIALRLDGRWVTPPLSSGLLDGVGREVALREGRLTERILRVEDLSVATGLAFLNSLRGWLPAALIRTGS